MVLMIKDQHKKSLPDYYKVKRTKIKLIYSSRKANTHEGEMHETTDVEKR